MFLIMFVIAIPFDTTNEVIYFGLSSFYVQLLALQNIKQLSSLRKNIFEIINEEHEREIIQLGQQIVCLTKSVFIPLFTVV